jgi:hypothetical protein
VDGIVKIEDVTERARQLKKALDEDVDEKSGLGELAEMGLAPVEEEYVVDEELREILGMDEGGGGRGKKRSEVIKVHLLTRTYGIRSHAYEFLGLRCVSGFLTSVFLRVEGW